MIDTITDYRTVATTGITASWLGTNLPEIIQVLTAVYIVLAVVHKAWQLYKDWNKKDESN